MEPNYFSPNPNSHVVNAIGLPAPGLVQRLWPDAPRFLEIDALLNYLFHEAENMPSFAYYVHHEPRQLIEQERSAEVERWARSFAKWVQKDSNPRWREKRSTTIRKLLAKERIDDLTRDEVKDVVHCMNCMTSHPLNRHRFLNPANNELDAITRAWKVLVHGRADGKKSACRNVKMLSASLERPAFRSS